MNSKGCIFLVCCPVSLTAPVWHRPRWAGNPPPAPALSGKPGLQTSPKSRFWSRLSQSQFQTGPQLRAGMFGQARGRVVFELLWLPGMFRECRIKEESQALLFYEFQWPRHSFAISFLQYYRPRCSLWEAGASSVLSLFPSSLGSQEGLFSPLLEFFPLHNWHFSMTGAWQTLHSKHLVIDWVSGCRNPVVLSPRLSRCWWLMYLSLCEHTPDIPQSSNLFLVLHHQKVMVHINEVLSRPPGDFKIHQTLSKGQEQLVWLTARDTHFLFW